MSADKFQQQAHQKMEELRLQPNEQVWVEVERRIREKKRRRVLVIWFLFGGLLLGGGSFFLFNQQGNKNETAFVAEKSNNKKTENNLPVTKNETNETNIVTTNNNSDKEQEKTIDSKNEKNEQENNVTINTKSEEKVIIRENKSKPVPAIQKSQLTPATIAKKQKTKLKAIKPVVIAETKPAEIKKEKEGPIVSDPMTEVKTQPQTVKSDNPIVSVPSTKANDEKQPEIKTNKDSVEKTEVVAEQKVDELKKDVVKKQAKKNKWELGINMAFGNSRLTEGNFLDLNMNKSADMFSAPQGGNSNTPPPVNYADSIPSKGPYWNIGISAKKKLGKKTSFSTGLNLAVYTTKQRVGTFVDSIYPINNDIRSLTYSGFYRPGQTKTFKNHYYFIQVPLLFNWQLNKGEKLPPIVSENGFLPSFLIGSNALAYDKQTRTFYKDKRLYNDVQLVYHTGLTTRLFDKGKHPLTVGVYYNFNISMLQKVSQPNYNYLNSFGIKLNWVIKK